MGRAFVECYRFARRGWAKSFSVLVSGAFAEFGHRSVLEPPIRLRGERRIAIGNGVFIGSGSWLEVHDDADPAVDVVLSVGDGTSIVGSCVLSAVSSLTIGRRVLMARNVYIADHTHAFSDPDLPILDQGIDRIGAVQIGDGAWIGENVLIAPGVRIGAGAVVGANAVVTRNVPDHAVVAGAPAREMRRVQRDP